MKFGEEAKRASLKVSASAIITSVYAILTISLGDLGYSWIQVRISESLTPLPFLIGPPAITGLVMGCAIANLFSPVGLPDMIFGPLLTLFAAFLSWKFSFGRKLVACLYPVLVNALGVSAYVSSFYGTPYWIGILAIATGELIAAVFIGYPLMISVERMLLKSRVISPL